jgi:hypothetical protein
VKGITYLIPKPEQDARRDSISKRWTDLFATLKTARENSIVVDQTFVSERAKELGLDDVVLEPGETKRADVFQYHIEYGIVTINEVRKLLELPSDRWRRRHRPAVRDGGEGRDEPGDPRGVTARDWWRSAHAGDAASTDERHREELDRPGPPAGVVAASALRVVPSLVELVVLLASRRHRAR